MYPYSALVREHFESPRNVGLFSQDLPSIGTGVVGIPGRSNVIQIQFALNKQGIISQAYFKIHGCVVSIACASWITEQLKGMTLDQAEALSHQAIVNALTIPAKKLYCALLAEDALKSAIANYKDKQLYGKVDQATSSKAPEEVYS